LRLTSEIAARRRLRSVDSPTMLVPSTRPSTLGDRAFPVVAARAWNSLPPQTRVASSLLTFQRETKSHLFRQSLGWRCLCWLTAKLSARDVQHYLCFFIKCPRNCCLVMVSLKNHYFL